MRIKTATCNHSTRRLRDSVVVIAGLLMTACVANRDPPLSCDPSGTWQLHYRHTGGTVACAPADGETLVLSKRPDGDEWVVKSGTPDFDTCGGGNREVVPESSLRPTSSATGGSTCDVTVETDANWCQSGELQCEHRRYELHFRGDTVSGVGRYERCWRCGATISGPYDEIEIKGERL